MGVSQQVTKKMGDFLLNGYTMLAATCTSCHEVPLMKLGNGPDVCVKCKIIEKAAAEANPEESVVEGSAELFIAISPENAAPKEETGKKNKSKPRHDSKGAKSAASRYFDESTKNTGRDKAGGKGELGRRKDEKEIEKSAQKAEAVASQTNLAGSNLKAIVISKKPQQPNGGLRKAEEDALRNFTSQMNQLCSKARSVGSMDICMELVKEAKLKLKCISALLKSVSPPVITQPGIQQILVQIQVHAWEWVLSVGKLEKPVDQSEVEHLTRKLKCIEGITKVTKKLKLFTESDSN